MRRWRGEGARGRGGGGKARRTAEQTGAVLQELPLHLLRSQLVARLQLLQRGRQHVDERLERRGEPRPHRRAHVRSACELPQGSQLVPAGRRDEVVGDDAIDAERVEPLGGRPRLLFDRPVACASSTAREAGGRWDGRGAQQHAPDGGNGVLDPLRHDVANGVRDGALEAFLVDAQVVLVDAQGVGGHRCGGGLVPKIDAIESVFWM